MHARGRSVEPLREGEDYNRDMDALVALTLTLLNKLSTHSQPSAVSGAVGEASHPDNILRVSHAWRDQIADLWSGLFSLFGGGLHKLIEHFVFASFR